VIFFANPFNAGCSTLSNIAQQALPFSPFSSFKVARRAGANWKSFENNIESAAQRPGMSKGSKI
jgi:hypothetical protein